MQTRTHPNPRKKSKREGLVNVRIAAVFVVSAPRILVVVGVVVVEVVVVVV
jgi:hypothetical protein